MLLLNHGRTKHIPLRHFLAVVYINYKRTFIGSASNEKKNIRTVDFKSDSISIRILNNAYLFPFWSLQPNYSVDTIIFLETFLKSSTRYMYTSHYIGANYRKFFFRKSIGSLPTSLLITSFSCIIECTVPRISASSANASKVLNLF